MNIITSVVVVISYSNMSIVLGTNIVILCSNIQFGVEYKHAYNYQCIIEYKYDEQYTIQYKYECKYQCSIEYKYDEQYTIQYKYECKQQGGVDYILHIVTLVTNSIDTSKHQQQTILYNTNMSASSKVLWITYMRCCGLHHM